MRIRLCEDYKRASLACLKLSLGFCIYRVWKQVDKPYRAMWDTTYCGFLRARIRRIFLMDTTYYGKTVGSSLLNNVLYTACIVDVDTTYSSKSGNDKKVQANSKGRIIPKPKGRIIPKPPRRIIPSLLGELYMPQVNNTLHQTRPSQLGNSGSTQSLLLLFRILKKEAAGREQEGVILQQPSTKRRAACFLLFAHKMCRYPRGREAS
nr:hypothetical protein [Tanacetum cinerariifolium]